MQFRDWPNKRTQEVGIKNGTAVKILIARQAQVKRSTSKDREILQGRWSTQTDNAAQTMALASAYGRAGSI